MQGTAAAALSKTVSDLVSHNWRARPGSDSYFVVESVSVAPGANTATTVECVWDTGVIYEPNAAPDGSDIIVNDQKTSERFQHTLYLESGRWMVGDEKTLEQHTGVNQCPPPG
jgi:hypothetical protein